jgi:ribosomal subunit interface protein
MEIIIHAKKQPLAADFREKVETRLARLERFKVRIDRIELTVTHEQNPRQGKQAHRVLITTYGAGPLVRAEAASYNDLSAFDDAAEAMELQLRKIHERSKDVKRV